MISSDCVFGDRQVFFYCTQSEFFVCLIGLAFFEPRDYRGVFFVITTYLFLSVDPKNGATWTIPFSISTQIRWWQFSHFVTPFLTNSAWSKVAEHNGQQAYTFTIGSLYVYFVFSFILSPLPFFWLYSFLLTLHLPFVFSFSAPKWLST